VAALEALEHNALIDGEVVLLDDKGMPSFDLLQKHNENWQIVYYCFDILWLDGYDLRKLPLLERKTILGELLQEMIYFALANILITASGCTNR
jgi:bifunctional non-homologous end joining protein LigD